MINDYTKYNLGVGVYLDENGNVPVLESVKGAAQLLYEKKAPCVYLPMDGLDSFCEATKKLLFGPTFQQRKHNDNSNTGRNWRFKVGCRTLTKNKKSTIGCHK